MLHSDFETSLAQLNAFDPDVRTARTLAADWYTDQRVLEWERRRLFATTWQYVGALNQLRMPGDFLSAEIAGEPVIVVRDEAGVLRAFYNVCQHRAGPLVEERSGSCKSLRCAYHGWTYGLDGALKRTPQWAPKTGFCLEKHGLRPLRVEPFGPLVFIHQGDGVPPLAELFGEMVVETAALKLDEFQFYKRHVYTLNCDWKVYVDNYLEGYHIPYLHPGLMQEIDYPAYRTETRSYHSRQFAPAGGGAASLYRRGLATDKEPEALYYWVFPNLMFNIYPDNLQINHVLPLASGKTAVIFDWYVRDLHRAGLDEDWQQSFRFSDGVQKEDEWICERVQRGLASRGYDQGPYAGDLEIGVHQFHHLYARQMAGALARHRPGGSGT